MLRYPFHALQFFNDVFSLPVPHIAFLTFIFSCCDVVLSWTPVAFTPFVPTTIPGLFNGCSHFVYGYCSVTRFARVFCHLLLLVVKHYLGSFCFAPHPPHDVPPLFTLRSFLPLHVWNVTFMFTHSWVTWCQRKKKNTFLPVYFPVDYFVWF